MNQQPLTGKNNKRLKSEKMTASEMNSSVMNESKGECGCSSEHNMPHPTLSNVEDAKEWVDDGSRL